MLKASRCDDDSAAVVRSRVSSLKHGFFYGILFFMKVIRAEVIGYCEGVRRAVEAAEHALETYRDCSVYTLGPLIHNQTALDALGKKGLRVLAEKDIASAENGSVVIIRAHGVPPETVRLLEERGCTVINATCTRVTASQNIAAAYAQKGYSVILAGDSNHGEVTGIAGYAGPRFMLVQDRVEAESIHIDRDEKAVLLSQTTFSPAEFDAISAVLCKKNKTTTVMNTICPATRERQDALKKLCPLTDGVLVIGGRNSANTKRLLLTAQQLCVKAALIETAEEIPEVFFTFDTVGLTAGASTPDSVIDDVERRLSEYR